MIEIIIAFLIGYVTHAFIGYFWKHYDGYFEIDDSSTEKTVWMLRYDGDPEEIKKHKELIFKVDVK